MKIATCSLQGYKSPKCLDIQAAEIENLYDFVYVFHDVQTSRTSASSLLFEVRSYFPLRFSGIKTALRSRTRALS